MNPYKYVCTRPKGFPSIRTYSPSSMFTARSNRGNTNASMRVRWFESSLLHQEVGANRPGFPAPTIPRLLSALAPAEQQGPGGPKLNGYYRAGSDHRKDGEAVGW
jgi:hypothetical protein